MPINARSTGNSPPTTPGSNSATYTQGIRSDALLVASVRNRDEPTFAPGVEIVRCKLDDAYNCGSVFDFSHTGTLFRLGEEAADAALRASVATVDPLVA